MWRPHSKRSWRSRYDWPPRGPCLWAAAPRMSLSNERARPKSLRFVDVSAERRTPGWLAKRNDEPHRVGPGERVDRLVPPEVPSHERPPLAPVLDSVRPPAARPSQYPGSQFPTSQYPASQYPSSPPGAGSQYPGAPDAGGLEPYMGASPEPRFDTQVEDLVPRAE